MRKPVPKGKVNPDVCIKRCNDSGLSRKQLAAKAGMSVRSLQDILAGELKNQQLIEKLAHALECDVDELTQDAQATEYVLSARLCQHCLSFTNYLDESRESWAEGARESMIRGIEAFVRSPEVPSGYVLITGPPGTGKSALLAELVRRWELPVYHFDVPEWGPDARRACIGNICARLIELGRLPIEDLPVGFADDGSFLSRVAHGALEQLDQERLIIAIDSSDVLFAGPHRQVFVERVLPRHLPRNVFFVLTAQDSEWIERGTGYAWRCDLDSGTPEHEEDVRTIIEKYIFGSHLKEWMRGLHLDGRRCSDLLWSKSRGNLLYLKHVIETIANDAGAYPRTDDLPDGLSDYYRRRWTELRQEDNTAFDDIHAKVVCALAAARVSVAAKAIAEWLGLPLKEVQNSLAMWTDAGFARSEQSDNDTKRYRLYHVALRDFLEADHHAEVTGSHALIVTAAQRKLKAAGERQRERHALPGDYDLRFLPEHAATSSVPKQRLFLRSLLLDPEWLRAGLSESDPADVIADYAWLPDDETLQHVRAALRASLPALRHDPTQLAPQLMGRLSGLKAHDLHTMLTQTSRSQTETWLRPLTPSLVAPGEYPVRTFAAHSGQVRALALCRDGGRIVSAADDKTLRVWDVESGWLLGTLITGREKTLCLAACRDNQRAVSGSADGAVRVWELTRLAQIEAWMAGRKAVWGVAASRDTEGLVSGSSERQLKVWAVGSRMPLHVFAEHTGQWGSVPLLVTSEHILSLTGEGDMGWLIKAWDLKKPSEQRILLRWASERRLAAVSGDGERALIAPSHSGLEVWDLRRRKTLHTLPGHRTTMSALAISENGNRVVSAAGVEPIRVWDVEKESQISRLGGHRDDVTVLTMNANGERVLAGTDDGMIHVWDVRGGKGVRRVGAHEHWVAAVAISQDGRIAASASRDGTLKLWNAQTGVSAGALPGHDSPVLKLAMTPDKRTAVSGGEDGSLKVWDLRDKQHKADLQGGNGKTQRQRMPGKTAPVCTLAITADGRFVISSSKEDALLVWALDGKPGPKPLYDHSDQILAVAACGADSLVVSSSADATLRLWDLTTWACKKVVPTPKVQVLALAVSDDGRLLLGGCSDSVVRLWNTGGGSAPKELRGHRARITAVKLSADGRRALSSSADGDVKLWDVPSQRVIASFSDDLPLLCCDASADMQTLIAAGQSGNVHFLRVEGDTRSGTV